ncbi:MAG: hypothetical protein QOF48_227 [Verrucomicrobiota bacterium]|jgi:hypothetical protein
MMIKHMFIASWFAVMACAALHAGEPSIKIALGIREGKWGALTNVAYPLAFRIENTGKELIKEHQIPALFFKGVIHVLPKDGKEQQTDVQKMWRTVVHDLQPGATLESPVVGNIVTFFPSAKDGDYQVWWTLADLKSNVLRFTVTKGKVIRNE